MHQAKTGFNLITQKTSFEFNYAGGSVTNRGEQVAIINGVVELQPLESYSIPVIDPLTEYNTQLDIEFSGTGSKKVVIQVIKMMPNLALLKSLANQGQNLEQAINSMC